MTEHAPFAAGGPLEHAPAKTAQNSDDSTRVDGSLRVITRITKPIPAAVPVLEAGGTCTRAARSGR
jgi:hypothetical protein